MIISLPATCTSISSSVSACKVVSASASKTNSAPLKSVLTGAIAVRFVLSLIT